MTTKKKGSGKRTIDLIENALRKMKCSIEDFFRRASKNIEGFNVGEAVRMYKLLRDKGMAAVGAWKIPVHVIKFAEAA